MQRKMWIVRVIRVNWFHPDYIGMYLAVSAVAALSAAGRDPYFLKMWKKHVVRVEAVESDFQDVANVRDDGDLVEFEG